MTDTLHYFAYGSNLHPRRLQARVPSARVVGSAELPGHVLHFHKRGQDRSGKCNVLASTRPEDRVLGVIYQIASHERIHLDRAEGLGAGYELDYSALPCRDGIREVFFYRAHPAHIDDRLRPFDWYRTLVLEGGRFHGFPDHWLAAVGAVEAIADRDRERDTLHRRLLTAAD